VERDRDRAVDQDPLQSLDVSGIQKKMKWSDMAFDILRSLCWFVFMYL
jgi:hypothetical protein